MTQFDLSVWLKDKSRQVVTRDGKPVRIVCWDRNTTYWKIIGLVTSPDGSTENPYTYDVNGNESDGYLHDHRNDLFFADEEEELSEFEKELQTIISEASHWTSNDGSISTYCQFGDKEIKKISGQILDLARKELQPEFDKKLKEAYNQGGIDTQEEITKSLPKWKKIPQDISRKDLFDMMHKHIVLAFNDCVDYYYIDEADLRKLPKEE